MTAEKIFSQFRELNTTKRGMGDTFERFFKKYLLTDPLYADVLEDVWMWSEWSGRNGKSDTGIDLVAVTKDTNEYWAIQCKFYADGHTVSKVDIDSFLSASGNKFTIQGQHHSFSRRLIVATTNTWGKNAEAAITSQTIPVTRILLDDLANAPIQWSKFSINEPDKMVLVAKKKPLHHQTKAIIKVKEGFETQDRGKMIMACGTGKTYTSLKLAEEVAPNGTVLFLVPSISLLSQTLREWTAEAALPLHPIAICSDAKAGSSDEDIGAVDLILPASTDPKKITSQYLINTLKPGLTAFFSTYQSIDVVSAVQKQSGLVFDLIICDEAHRTTGVTLAGDDESAFVKVHDNTFLPAKKRLYMTATPRIYGDDSKQKAQEADAILCSMDDENTYGPELYFLGFSEAVGNGLLSDYKVLVLAVDENYVSQAFQHMMTDDDGHELHLEDKVRVIGCWNGLSKRSLNNAAGESGFEIDPRPMKRAVAFSSRIADSKMVKQLFQEITHEYSVQHPDDKSLVNIEIDHVDGTYNALERETRIKWLKAETEDNTCRILTNARCLSEGIDVPALDAVMFLSPRNSIVDIVQSVGRVMRKTEGKQYGYVILPIGIPAGMKPEDALKDNKKYRIVWDVLQALRAHDDRFNNTINKIDLNKFKPDQIQVIGVTGGADVDGKGGSMFPVQVAMDLSEMEDWKNGIFAKIVEKCGTRAYWENWAKDVAGIAERHIEQLNTLLSDPANKHKAEFDLFLKGLQSNLNATITQQDAVEMLAQHMITKPVFDALFEGYSFVQSNPVSRAMQKMLEVLEDGFIAEESEKLNKFYVSVKERAAGIDNVEGKQKIIIELYDKFFSTAFKKQAEKLGIVYTPVECVDFIIHSIEFILNKEFSMSLSDKNVHILDPFVGTGTFIVRLLQSGIIRKEDLLFKYTNEIHANEIVLLAYYIAAINIEETFHGILDKTEYVPFDGIVLTDTFQMTEPNWVSGEASFPENSERAAVQKRTPVFCIMANPPYSVGQGSANDNNQNVSYPALEQSISETYSKFSNAVLQRGLYDSYIKAFRWASERIKNQGVVCFISNGAYIDNAGMDGFRKCLVNEFTDVYCFNLRGNARTSGEQRRREAGNVFDSGSRTPIAITLLVKNSKKISNNTVHYFDIGDYLSRREKLNTIKNYHDISNIEWSMITPDPSNDWINFRNTEFDVFIPLGDKKLRNGKTIFEPFYSLGIATNRDTWAYNFSEQSLSNNIERLLSFYNKQADDYKAMLQNGTFISVEDFIDGDPQKIKWSRKMRKCLSNDEKLQYSNRAIVKSMYRPYTKQFLYFDGAVNEELSLWNKLLPNSSCKNIVITVSGLGASKPFSATIVNVIPDLQVQFNGQSFPLYYYEETTLKTRYTTQQTLFQENEKQYIRKDAITDFYFERCRKLYGEKVNKVDIFYYVYGILHSEIYKSKYESDLKKSLPRIPFAKNFWEFSIAGRALAEFHLNYETVTPYPLKETGSGANYKVEKMRFPKKGERSSIIYNASVTLSGIPDEAYEYIVNGKSALEWIMERYQVTIDKDSGIKNDPNEWSEDPRYIIDLVKRIVTVSIETMKIVKTLPSIEEV